MTCLVDPQDLRPEPANPNRPKAISVVLDPETLERLRVETNRQRAINPRVSMNAIARTAIRRLLDGASSAPTGAA